MEATELLMEFSDKCHEWYLNLYVSVYLSIISDILKVIDKLIII
jgi:hypothetical protein